MPHSTNQDMDSDNHTAGAAKQLWQTALQGFSVRSPLLIDSAGAGECLDIGETSSAYVEDCVQLSNVDTARLCALASQQHVTICTIVRGAWTILLSRYSREEDLVNAAKKTEAAATALLDRIEID